MLFNKKIEPCCAYCARGSVISPDEVMCLRRGVVSSSGECSLFRYDPLKREPARPGVLGRGEYTAEDFKL